MSTTAKPVVLVALFVLAVILAVGSAVHRSAEAQVGAPGGMVKAPTYVLEGNYRVSYSCTFPDKTSKQDKEEQVKRIEFHPEYVVLINQTGAGRIVPVYSIKELSWEPS